MKHISVNLYLKAFAVNMCGQLLWVAKIRGLSKPRLFCCQV